MARNPVGYLAAEITKLVSERQTVASRLAIIDRELATVRRALGYAPDQVTATCEVCENEFTKKRHDQRICSGCREHDPHRSVEDVKERAQSGLQELRCKGVGDGDDLIECDKSVMKPANRRGPVRCPDCQLAHKRFVARRSLVKHRAAKTAPPSEAAKRIETADVRLPPPQPWVSDEPMPPEGIRKDPVEIKNDRTPLAERVRAEQKRLAERARAAGHGIRAWTMSQEGAGSICYGSCGKCGAGARIIYRMTIDRFEVTGSVLTKACTSAGEPEYETVWGGGEGLTAVGEQRGQPVLDGKAPNKEPSDLSEELGEAA